VSLVGYQGWGPRGKGYRIESQGLTPNPNPNPRALWVRGWGQGQRGRRGAGGPWV